MTPLPTQLTNDIDPTIEYVNDSVANPLAVETVYEDVAALAEIKKNIDPNAIILAEVLTDKAISWRIHNCKISEKTTTQDLPMQFLYHYDSLEDAIKQANPLTPKLLSQFNTLMTASAAAKLIGVDSSLILQPWHVKVTGSLVVFSETLQLAVRLHWTNTGKTTQQIYTQNQADAVVAAFKDWHFFGRVDVLYKNDKQALISIDEENVDNDTFITFTASSDYQYLPATHALTVIAKLETNKSELPWFEAAILERVE